MFAVSFVFAQIMEHLPWFVFRQCVVEISAKACISKNACTQFYRFYAYIQQLKFDIGQFCRCFHAISIRYRSFFPQSVSPNGLAIIKLCHHNYLININDLIYFKLPRLPNFGLLEDLKLACA